VLSSDTLLEQPAGFHVLVIQTIFMPKERGRSTAVAIYASAVQLHFERNLKI